MCRKSLCGDSGITVSLINYCCSTSASHCEVSIEILILMLISNPINPHWNAITHNTFCPILFLVMWWFMIPISLEATVMISKSSSALASACSCCWYHPAQLKVRRKSVPTNWMFFCIFLLCICIHPFTMTKTKQTTMEKAAPKKAKKTAEEQII